MFNTTHLLYMLISGVISAGLLVLLRLLKRERLNLILLRVLSVGTVVIHYSPLWVDFFTTGTAVATIEMLMPVYPCHICMWLLLIASFTVEKKGIAATVVREFAFWGGTVCGIVGIVLNENFAANPTLADYDVLKGLLSHSTMVAGCILLLVAGYIKLGVGRGLRAVLCGLGFFMADGLLINGLLSAFELPPRNAMYLQQAPFAELPWINTATIGLAALLVTFLANTIYEWIALSREQRWYVKIANGMRNLKHKGEKG